MVFLWNYNKKHVIQSRITQTDLVNMKCIKSIYVFYIAENKTWMYVIVSLFRSNFIKWKKNQWKENWVQCTEFLRWINIRISEFHVFLSFINNYFLFYIIFYLKKCVINTNLTQRNWISIYFKIKHWLVVGFDVSLKKK